jgi:hypothetical protein
MSLYSLQQALREALSRRHIDALVRPVARRFLLTQPVQSSTHYDTPRIPTTWPWRRTFRTIQLIQRCATRITTSRLITCDDIARFLACQLEPNPLARSLFYEAPGTSNIFFPDDTRCSVAGQHVTL